MSKLSKSSTVFKMKIILPRMKHPKIMEKFYKLYTCEAIIIPNFVGIEHTDQCQKIQPI